MCLLHSTLVFGLAVQLYHDIGSKQLIETLHSNGFCASYAHHEIEKIQDSVYVPDGIIPMHQEGADNIDINTETVDGKNTFHSMARTVFQIRHYAVDLNISQSKKKRSQERSVQISNSASSLTACLAFSKPKTRGVPGRTENAFDRITECSSNLSKTSDILWLLLRSISRKILDIPIRFPVNQPQQIPFWTDYNSDLSEYKSEFLVVSYAPIIESKPNDMSTVFTTM